MVSGAGGAAGGASGASSARRSRWFVECVEPASGGRGADGGRSMDGVTADVVVAREMGMVRKVESGRGSLSSDGSCDIGTAGGVTLLAETRRAVEERKAIRRRYDGFIVGGGCGRGCSCLGVVFLALSTWRSCLWLLAVPADQVNSKYEDIARLCVPVSPAPIQLDLLGYSEAHLFTLRSQGQSLPGMRAGFRAGGFISSAPFITSILPSPSRSRISLHLPGGG